jgi:hypothetical protein
VARHRFLHGHAAAERDFQMTEIDFLNLGLPDLVWAKVDHFSIKAWATCR